MGPPSPALDLDVDQQSFAWIPEDDFVNHVAADVDPVKARVMFVVQQPLNWIAERRHQAVRSQQDGAVSGLLGPSRAGA